jgi:hypothetical protein
MNKLKQFFFHPEGKDRLIWAWIDAAFSLFFFAMVFLTYHKWGRWHWVCTVDSILCLFNFAMCWLYGTLYDEWKKNRPPV